MFYKDKFKEIRISRNLSQRRCGELIGKSKMTIHRWERGINGPNDSSIRFIAKTLNISVSDISDLRENEKLLPHFYNQLNNLDRNTFDISTKTDSEKIKLFITLQDRLEQLSWENNYYKTAFTQFSDIMQSIRFLIYEKDSNQRYTFVNKYFMSYFKITNEKVVLGLKNDDIWKDQNSWNELSKLEIEVYESKYNVIHRKISIPKPFSPDGKGIATITPIFGKEGKIEKVVGSVLDLTGEEVLREKYFYMESVLDNLEHVIWIVKPKPYRHYLYISKAIKKLYNLYASEFYKNVNKWQDFIVKEDKKRVLDEFKKGKTELTYKIRTEDGCIKWIQHFIYITEINNEKFEFGIIKNITEIKEAQETKDLLELNVNTMNNGLIIFDINSEKVIYQNKAVKKITGYPSHILYKGGIKFWKNRIIHSDFLKEYELSLYKSKANKQIEYKIIRKDGSERWIRSYRNIEKFLSRKCYIAVLNDVTKEKEAQRIREVLQISIDSMTDGLFVAEINSGKYVYINKAIIDTYGYPLDFFYSGGRDFWLAKCLHPDFLKEHNKKVLYSDKPQSYQFKIIRSDKSIRWIDSIVNTKTIYGEKYFISIEKDITNQKQIISL